MQTPLEFLDVFRSTLRSAGITFAVTSGMACIRYGLQQTTKDSDWIVAAERIVWEAVNRHRQAVYQNAWKDWYRRWQATADWPWPVSEPFAAQHERIVTAARDCGLPPDPLAGTVRHAVYAAGLADAAMLANIEEDRLTTIAPPIEEVLP